MSEALWSFALWSFAPIACRPCRPLHLSVSPLIHGGRSTDKELGLNVGGYQEKEWTWFMLLLMLQPPALFTVM